MLTPAPDDHTPVGICPECESPVYMEDGDTCEQCGAKWQEAPEYLDRTDEPTLGTCCLCEAPGATVLVMLTARSYIPGHGWGCAACGLSQNGASAVLCAACAAPYEQPNAPHIELHLKWACRGYPGSDGRIPFEDLRGEHQHIRHRHPEVPQAPALQILPTDTRWPTHVEEGRGCFCSRCHQTIHDGTVAIRVFATNADWQYRYHGVCFGAEPSDWEDPYSEEDWTC